MSDKKITFEDLKSGRIKPEFGNPQHIEAVREFERENNDDGVERSYRVSIRCECYYDVVVKAPNKKIAKELAMEEPYDMSAMDIDDKYVECVEESE